MWIMTLAHGAAGIWDEVIPALLLLGFAVILLGAGILSRRNNPPLDDNAEEQADADVVPAQDSTTASEKPSSDHFQLD